MDKQGILSWPNPSPETVLFFSGRVEPPHNSQEDLGDDLSVNSYCRMEMDDDRDEVSATVNVANPLMVIMSKKKTSQQSQLDLIILIGVCVCVLTGSSVS